MSTRIPGRNLSALLLTLLSLLPSAAAAEPLRPPAVPLVAHDPYFSIWSGADKLTDTETVHWTGKRQRLGSSIRIDGKEFRLLGKEPWTIPALDQVGVEVLPTRTICDFEGQGMRVRLTFMTPALPDDLDILARPVTYLTWDVRAVDGKEHEVSLSLESSGEPAVNLPDQEVVSKTQASGDLIATVVGSKDQPVLAKKGDDLRIDWGYFAVAIKRAAVSEITLAAGEGADRKVLQRGMEGSADLKNPVPAEVFTSRLDMTLGKVGGQEASRWLMLAYDDLLSIRYFQKELQPFWRRNGGDLASLLRVAAADYERLKERCAAFDTALMQSLRQAGGEKYAQLCALAYRQTLAGNKVAADANGQPLMFPKENFSNGCIGTVDVLFPQAPFFLVFSPGLTKAMLVPVLDYAVSGRWPYGYAPHDLGKYPHATGQVYGMLRGDGYRMPVEESGNMLIMLAALARQEGNADVALKYWPTLTKWADYLVSEGLDPTNQLCSADMFGHLPRNANLALKAVIGIGGYAQMCGYAGKKAEADKYMEIARNYAAKWQDLARDEGRTRLSYDKPGTWSMKHNLIWDRVLGLNLFPNSVGDAEIAWYLKVQNKYGLPVDNRTDTCLIDWALWSIAPAAQDKDFQALLEPIWRYAHETPTRVPLSDWFITTNAKKRNFQARSVVGGVFIKLLADKATWTDWAARGANCAGPWAPIPIGKATKEVVPAERAGKLVDDKP